MKKLAIKKFFQFSISFLAIFVVAEQAMAILPPPPWALRPTKIGSTSWDMTRNKFTVSGDFDQVLGSDVAFLYDYGSNNLGIINFPSGSSVGKSVMYRSGVGNWSFKNTKFVVPGNFNGDGQSDIAAIYDYGNNNMGIWVFSSNGTTFSAKRQFITGPGKWNLANTKFVTSGDYNGDARTDIAMMYDYGNNNMGIWVFTSTGTSFSVKRQYLSGAGRWGVPNTKFVVSFDPDLDNSSELAAIYDYGNNNMGIWVFNFANGSAAPSRWYLSGAGKWYFPNIKFVTGNLNNDIELMYDYGNKNMAIWTFNPIGPPNTLYASRTYLSGPGNWSIANTKALLGGLFLNAYSPVGLVAVYDSGHSVMTTWNFGYKLLGPN